MTWPCHSSSVLCVPTREPVWAALKHLHFMSSWVPAFYCSGVEGEIVILKRHRNHFITITLLKERRNNQHFSGDQTRRPSYFELHLRGRGRQSCCIRGEGVAERAARLTTYGSHPSNRAFLSLGTDSSIVLWLAEWFLTALEMVQCTERSPLNLGWSCLGAEKMKLFNWGQTENNCVVMKNKTVL